MAASDMQSTATFLMEMHGKHWHADRVEDWVSELGLTNLSDEIAHVMRHRLIFYDGFPQLTDIDNIIRHLTPQFPKCPPDVYAVVSCMLRNSERFDHECGGWGLNWAHEYSALEWDRWLNRVEARPHSILITRT